MEWVKVGKTGAAHGLQGELKLQIEQVFEEFIEAIEVLFLEIKGEKMPHFVEHYRGGGALILKLEGVEDRKGAEQLAQKPVWVRRSDLPANEAEWAPETGLYYGGLVGFEMIDESLGSLGPILAVEAFPYQEMAVVNYQGHEVLVPLNAAFIKKRERQNKTVLVDLPQGLLSVNLPSSATDEAEEREEGEE